GLCRHGDQVILAYTVGTTEILDMPGYEIDPAHPDEPIFTRTLEFGPSSDDLTMRVALETVAISLVGDTQVTLLRRDGFTLLNVPGAGTSRVVKVLMSRGGSKALDAYAAASPPAAPLDPLTHGGPRRWPEVVKTPAAIGRDDGPLAVDVLTVPDNNPWLCQMRPSGLDFLPGGHSAAVCTWDGDVWLAGGIDEPAQGLTWQRIAAGLSRRLGLKVVAGRIDSTPSSTGLESRCRPGLHCIVRGTIVVAPLKVLRQGGPPRPDRNFPRRSPWLHWNRALNRVDA